ncbi:MAG TPA: hypothetical protein VMQ62_10350 [Dongiaceae bacterium]|nr:hypothetical protein [Dongiaceae bacterium]
MTIRPNRSRAVGRMALSLFLAGYAWTSAPANQGYVCGRPEIRMNFQGGPFGGSFYDVGFPSEAHRDPGPNGTIVVPEIENGGDVGLHVSLGPIPLGEFLMPSLYETAHAMANSQQPFEKGFGLTSPIMFAVEGHGCGLVAIDGSADIDKASLPTPVRNGHEEPIDVSALDMTVIPQTNDHLVDRSSVFLISVDPGSPDFLDLYPVTTEFGQSDFCCDASIDLGSWLVGSFPCDSLCATFHHKNKLAMVPLPGTPLRPNTLYAAVITNRVTRAGVPLQRSRGLVDLINCMNNQDFNGNPRLCDGTNPVKTEEDAAHISFPAYNAYKDALNVLRFSDNTAGLGNAKNTYQGPAIFDTISALTVFRTGDPTAGFRGMVVDALTNPSADWHLKSPIVPASAKFNPIDTADFSLTPDGEGIFPKIKAPAIFSEFCVYQADISMPNYQTSADTDLFANPPVIHQRIRFDKFGKATLDHNDDGVSGPMGRIFISIPREGLMPINGFPVVVLAREGGGGDVPLVNRGIDTQDFPGYGGTDTNGPDVISRQSGEGPALYFARAGYAGVQIDDTYGGARRPQGKGIGEEDNLIFGNRGSNEWAIRDNIRQMAVELAVLGARTLNMKPFGSVNDLSNCTQVRCTYSSANGNTDPTVGRECHDVDLYGNPTGAADPNNPNPPAPVLPANTPLPLSFQFDTTQLAIMGHSVGASVVPLALSATDSGLPIYKRAILSGSGGSFMTNALHKQEPSFDPIPLTQGRHGLREMAESWVELDRGLESEGDPALGVVQLALEPGDTPPYDRELNAWVMSQDMHVPGSGYILDFQGIVDHYIQPPTSNAQTLAMGLGLGVTRQMSASPNGIWSDGYDADLGFYPPNAGFECEDLASGHPIHSNCFANDNHDFRAFMPFGSVLGFGGWKNGQNPLSPTHWDRTPLPVRGPSLVVQIDNDGHNPRFSDDDTAHTIGMKEDGHEAMWQHRGPKVQLQCFLRSAMRATTFTPAGNAIINDDVYNTGTDNSLTGVSECCAHRFDTTGPPLLDNCSSCAAYVCSQPGKAYCCFSTLPGWDQGCVDVAKPPTPAPVCSAWSEMLSSPPIQVHCGFATQPICPDNTPTCANPNCSCTGGWVQPATPPAPPQCDPGNPDR